MINHIGRKDNPHHLTKGQLELSNVGDLEVATEQDVMELNRDDCYVTDDPNTVYNAFIEYAARYGLTLSESEVVRLIGSIQFYDDTRQLWYDFRQFRDTTETGLQWLDFGKLPGV